MAYPNSLHRLVILGTLYDDTFATSLHIAATAGGDMSPVTNALLADIAGTVGAWWPRSSTAVDPSLLNIAKLTSIKLNRIDTAGHYQDGMTFEHTYGSPISGSGSPSLAPAQIATVVTLRTAVERGRASKGRMYFPCMAGFQLVGSDGRALPADALRAANAVKTLIDAINLDYATPLGGGVSGHVVVASAIGTGTVREVTGTSCGRVPDTMRSRRSKLLEDPQFDTV
jgi:hypothetical protein